MKPLGTRPKQDIIREFEHFICNIVIIIIMIIIIIVIIIIIRNYIIGMKEKTENLHPQTLNRSIQILPYLMYHQ